MKNKNRTLSISAETSVQGSTAEAEWNEVQSIISNYYGEWDKPDIEGAQNTRIPNTALLGNGDVGVSSAGNTSVKQFLISKSDFWEYNGNPAKKSFGSPMLIGSCSISAADFSDSVQNLAPSYKNVTASASHENMTPDRAVNGDWKSINRYEGWISPTYNDGDVHWIQLEFESPTTFNRWVVVNDSASRGSGAAINTKDCQIMISDDGENWDTVSTISGNNKDIIEVKMDEACTAKFVRLNVNNPMTGSDPRARIAQFELYNDETNDLNTHFYEKEDILSAEVDTEMILGGQTVFMKTYMAATTNIMVTKLCGVEAAVDLKLNLAPNICSSNIRPISVAANADGSITVTRATALTEENMPASELVQSIPYSSKVAVISKVIGTDSTTNVCNNTANLTFTLEPGKTVYLVTAICGGGRTYDANGNLWEGRIDPVVEAATLLDQYNTKDDIDALHKDHLNWWKEYWLQSYISLDTSNEDLATIQKYYYAAQYMLGSSVREDKVAVGLYGIWHANDTPNWHSDYHLNYNFISTFYGLATSNRVRMLLPATVAMLDYIPQGKKNAASIEHLRAIKSDFVDELIGLNQIDHEKGIEDAILFPVAIGPYGMTIENKSYLMETADAAYSIYPLIEYYNYTLDEDFLRNSLYPYIRLVNNFLKHWLIDNGDGTYTVYAGFCEGTESNSSWSKDPAYELAACKNCLRYGIEFSKKFDDNNWKKWENIYNGLADQPTTVVNGKKVFAFADQRLVNGQWIDMTQMYANPIPLDSVIPGEVHGFYSSDTDLEILKNTVQWYSDCNYWNIANNFPRLFTYAVNSRFPVSGVINKMATTIKEQMVANMMIEDGIHGIEKAGATEAVNNMMLLEDKGVIKLFGNWLKDTNAKFVRLRAPGALVFSAEYNGDTNEVVEGVTVYSEIGASATIASLWNEGMIVLDSQGKRVSVTIGTAPNHEEEITYTFDTVSGETYTLKKDANSCVR